MSEIMIFTIDFFLAKFLELAWGIAGKGGQAVLERFHITSSYLTVQKQLKDVETKISNHDKSKLKTALCDFNEALIILEMDKNKSPLKLVTGVDTSSFQLQISKEKFKQAKILLNRAQENGKLAANSETNLPVFERIMAWQVVFCCVGVIHSDDRECMLKIWSSFIQKILVDKEFSSILSKCPSLVPNRSGNDEIRGDFLILVRFLMGLFEFSEELSQNRLITVSQQKQLMVADELNRLPMGTLGAPVKNSQLWLSKIGFGKRIFTCPYPALNVALISHEKYYGIFKVKAMRGRLTNMINGQEYAKTDFREYTKPVKHSSHHRECCTTLLSYDQGNVVSSLAFPVRRYGGHIRIFNDSLEYKAKMTTPLNQDMDVVDICSTNSGWIIYSSIQNPNKPESKYSIWMKHVSDVSGSFKERIKIENFGLMLHSQSTSIAAASSNNGPIQIALVPGQKGLGNTIRIITISQKGEVLNQKDRRLSFQESVSDMASDENGDLFVISKRGAILKLCADWSESTEQGPIGPFFTDKGNCEYKIDSRFETILISQGRESKECEGGIQAGSPHGSPPNTSPVNTKEKNSPPVKGIDPFLHSPVINNNNNQSQQQNYKSQISPSGPIIPAPLPGLPPPDSPSQKNLQTDEEDVKQISNLEAFQRNKSEPEFLTEELQQTVGRGQSKADLLKKGQSNNPDLVINEQSTNREIKEWLQSKGFSVGTLQALEGQTGATLFGLSKTQLQDFCGREEGHRLFSQLLVQKNLTGYGTKSDAELNAILMKRKKRSETATITPDKRTQPQSSSVQSNTGQSVELFQAQNSGPA